MTRRRLAVLGSGGGSNFESLCREIDSLGENSPCEIAVVVADRKGAGILTRAAERGIPFSVLADSSSAAEILALFEKHAVDLVVLAGYLRLVPREVVARYSGTMLNVHPALLPSFGGPGMYGDRVHRSVLESGVTLSGVTVHLVSSEYDRGEILAQWPVPVVRGDTVRSLADRVLAVEHVLYPAVIIAMARGDAGAGRPCIFSPAAARADAGFMRGELSESQLREAIAQLTGGTPVPR